MNAGVVRVAVIGGGIAGTFAACFAARAGARVTLVERDDIGRHASGRNPGGLNPLHGPGIPGPLAPLALESLRIHRRCADEGMVSVAPQPKSRLNLVVDDATDLEAVHTLERRYNTTAGFSATWLSGPDLHEREPRLAPSITKGLLVEGDMHVEARRYTRAVARAAEARGATIARTSAVSVVTKGPRVVAVETASGVLPCDAVVVATGPWCDAPADWLAVTLPVVPVKGELLVVEVPGGSVACDLAWGDVAVYRLDATRALIGGTESRVGFDDRCTASARRALLQGASRIVPSLADAEVVDHWAALRPVTPDGIPILGLAPGWENVCLALGGGRKGMLFGPAMGMAAVDLLLEGSTSLPVDACSPERFAAARSE